MKWKFLKPKEKQQISIEVTTNLIEKLKQSDMSKEEFAKLCGTTVLTLDAIMYKGFVPSVYLALIMAAALNCRVEELFALKLIKADRIVKF